MKISTRLYLGFGIVLLLLAGIVASDYYNKRQVRDITDELVGPHLDQSAMIGRLAQSNQENARLILQLFLAATPAETTTIQKAIAANSASNSVLLPQLEKSFVGDPGEAQFRKMMASRKAFIAVRNRAIDLLLKDRKRDAALGLWNAEGEPALAAYAGSIQALAAFQAEESKAMVERMDVLSQRGLVGITVVGAFAVLLGIVFAWLITRSVTGSLRTAVGVSRQLSAGDLAVHIDGAGKDEVGTLLRSMGETAESLRNVVGRIHATSQTINDAATRVAVGNGDLAARTEEQAASLEETAASMEELTATVKQNADNARQAHQLASAASEVAARGGQAVGDVVETMESINAGSKKIADIIAVIDGIAFQTNILALNAAVEAARAGEQGRGFAVVATEVRGLAQRSAEAAKEIRGLIQASVASVDDGSRKVAATVGTIDEVVRSVQRVAQVVTEIAEASREQSSGIEQVNQAIAQMDEAVQGNSALVEKTQAALRELESDAAMLRSAVTHFRLDPGEVQRSSGGDADSAALAPEPVPRAQPADAIRRARKGGAAASSRASAPAARPGPPAGGEGEFTPPNPVPAGIPADEPKGPAAAHSKHADWAEF